MNSSFKKKNKPNKYLRLSALVSLTSFLFLASPLKVKAQPRRIAIFINGYQDCCSSGITDTKNAFSEMGIDWFDNPWDSVYPISDRQEQINPGEVTTVGSERFRTQMTQYLSSLPEGTEIFLIGHSFGGDSILHFLDNYQNYRTGGKGAVKIRLAAVIDPVGYAGTRANAVSNTVGSNVEYFFNRWQTNNAPPVDFINNGGRIANCQAEVCDEKEHSTARNSDGTARKVNCGKLEVGCEGAKWITQGINSRYDPGRKNEPRRHNDMPTDDFIEAQIIDVVKGLVATARKTSSANQFIDTIDIPISQLNNPGSFDARFRAIHNWAAKNGYAAGFPNFHQADYGQGVVYGTVLPKLGTVDVRDISAAELGNPPNNEARFRAIHNWAAKNGYAAGFPNFHQADYGQGVVYGTTLLKLGTVDVRDISAAELGNPSNNEERFRAVNDWAIRNGYAAGFPNFHQANYGNGVVYGTILIKK